MVAPLSSEPITIFDSDQDPFATEGGYEVAVALAKDGTIESVAIIDNEMHNLVEVPPAIALMIAKAINDKVRDPDASTLN